MYACNHLATYNTDRSLHYPSLHPIIDMYLRKYVSQSKGSRNAFVMSELIEGLKKYLRGLTALHCSYPYADESFFFGTRSRAKVCCHSLNYKHVASLKGYEGAQSLPPRTQSNVSSSTYPNTVRATTAASDHHPIWTHIYHMFMHDGHSNNGIHRMEDHTECQIKYRLSMWNRHFRGDHEI